MAMQRLGRGKRCRQVRVAHPASAALRKFGKLPVIRAVRPLREKSSFIAMLQIKGLVGNVECRQA